MQHAQLTYDKLTALGIWQQMEPITLERMSSVKLMNRIDTKYVLSEMEVTRLLTRAADEGYLVQQIGSRFAQQYDTLYFDTSEREMYLAHHNRQLTRQKIRTRTYVDNNQSFLEIKDKTNRGRTRKQRCAIALDSCNDFRAETGAMALFDTLSRYAIDSLKPALSTKFERITLVNRALTERLTIDFALHYTDVRSGRQASVPDMTIVELKQDGYLDSTMKRILQEMRIPPLKVSKYCLGTALTVEGIKYNRFKEKLRDIEKRLTLSQL